jgi:predicted AlkP superfamily phosphohydrolase/phosphomutase
MASKNGPRLLIVGLDGGTFDLIDPWVKEGHLPTFARLMREGGYDHLSSTTPPVTPPAWTSFMTGLNPGKHGLFDFLEPRTDRYGMQYTNGRSRKAKSLFRRLSDAGLRVGVMNVPMTYPPEEVNGFLISGMDTPDEECDFTYPSSLKEELRQAIGGLQVDIRHLGHMRTDAVRDATLDDLENLEAQRTRAALYLLSKYPTDVMMVVFNATDQVQHHFWHYYDPRHPQYDAEGAKKYGDAMLRIYRKVDASIAQLLAQLDEACAVVLVSDHGAGASAPNYLYLNRYLQQLGLLKMAETRPSLFSLAMGKADSLLRGVLTPQQKLRLSKLLPGLRERWESYLSFGAVNWGETKAYAFENAAAAPNVWINVKGERPNGIVEPGKAYDDLVALVRAKLLELTDPTTGRPLIRQVFHKSEIYSGPYVVSAPDLILDWWNDPAFVVHQSFPCREGDPVVVPKGKTIAGGVEWSGTHRSNGVMLFRGPGFRKGQKIGPASIIDMAPTLLHYLGLPVPEAMDGKVITTAFEEGHMAAHPITYQTEVEEQVHVEGQYTEEEAEKIRQRLAGLGYLED